MLFDGGTAGDVLDGRVGGSLLFPTEELDVQRCHAHALDGWMDEIGREVYRLNSYHQFYHLIAKGNFRDANDHDHAQPIKYNYVVDFKIMVA